jgi:hypothetical protein
MLLDKLVIGSCIESALYAFLNDCYYLPNRKDPPMFYRRLSTAVFGHIYETKVWSRLVISLGLLGKLINFDSSSSSIKIRDNTCTVSYGNHVVKNSFSSCYIFDSSGVDTENAILEINENTFLVLDDFEISTLGGKYEELASLNQNDNLASKIVFYTSDRVPGANFVTDCIVESILTEKQLVDFNYSDSITKIIVERSLQKLGVTGQYMGNYKNGRPKFRKPKVKHVSRSVFAIDNNTYASSENVKFVNTTLEDIINEYGPSR